MDIHRQQHTPQRKTAVRHGDKTAGSGREPGHGAEIR